MRDHFDDQIKQAFREPLTEVPIADVSKERLPYPPRSRSVAKTTLGRLARREWKPTMAGRLGLTHCAPPRGSAMWQQGYDPLHSPVLSTAVAAVPIVVLLGSLGVIRLKAHYAAAAGLVAALVVAIFVFGMPAGLAGRAALNGVGFGLLPIGWIIFNVLFLYQLTLQSGQF
jgi:hypothetical protein